MGDEKEDQNMVQIIYSKQFQFVLGIGYQVSGLLFAIGFLIIGMKNEAE
jgi:hypothetical protein